MPPPDIVILAERGFVSVFSKTVTETDPSFEPLVLLTLIQFTFSLTVHCTLDVTVID